MLLCESATRSLASTVRLILSVDPKAEDIVLGEHKMGMSSRASWLSVSLCLKSEPLSSQAIRIVRSLSVFLHSEIHYGRGVL